MTSVSVETPRNIFAWIHNLSRDLVKIQNFGPPDIFLICIKIRKLMMPECLNAKSTFLFKKISDYAIIHISSFC